MSIQKMIQIAMIKIAHIKMHFVFCQTVINNGSIKSKSPKLFFLPHSDRQCLGLSI